MPPPVPMRTAAGATGRHPHSRPGRTAALPSPPRQLEVQTTPHFVILCYCTSRPCWCLLTVSLRLVASTFILAFLPSPLAPSATVLGGNAYLVADTQVVRKRRAFETRLLHDQMAAITTSGVLQDVEVDELQEHLFEQPRSLMFSDNHGSCQDMRQPMGTARCSRAVTACFRQPTPPVIARTPRRLLVQPTAARTCRGIPLSSPYGLPRQLEVFVSPLCLRAHT